MTVSFLTLSNTSARTRLLVEAAKVREAMARSVIFEVTDFDDGVPMGRLKEAAALVKPFCRAVFAQIATVSSFAQSSKALGFSGLVIESPLARASEEDQSVWLLTMSSNLEGHSGAAIAANLSATTLLPMAAAAGFTHATVKA